LSDSLSIKRFHFGREGRSPKPDIMLATKAIR
jgi:hypothetical protein